VSAIVDGPERPWATAVLVDEPIFTEVVRKNGDLLLLIAVTFFSTGNLILYILPGCSRCSRERPRRRRLVGGRRNATAHLSFLSRAAFEQLANKHPEIYKSLVTLLAARLSGYYCLEDKAKLQSEAEL
jgi:hypothetical protein